MLYRRFLHVSLAIFATAVVQFGLPGSAGARESNFPNRRAIIVNSCPFVELSEFTFSNQIERTFEMRFHQDAAWKNVGSQSLLAFEMVILPYDAFDRRLPGLAWTVAGKNSADWSPLQPGETGKDGLIGLRDEKVFTAIAFVRAARLGDGTVWQVKDSDLLTALQAAAPGLKELGDLKSDLGSHPSE